MTNAKLSSRHAPIILAGSLSVLSLGMTVAVSQWYFLSFCLFALCVPIDIHRAERTEPQRNDE